MNIPKLRALFGFKKRWKYEKIYKGRGLRGGSLACFCVDIIPEKLH